MTCLHTHTIFCDGKADMETMCEAAFYKGLKSIGFSSHAPITKKTGLESQWHLPGEKLSEYIDTALKARKRWEGKLKVFLGLEVDYIEGLCGPADADIQELPLDYIIGAVHYIASPKDGRLFTVDAPPDIFDPGLEHFGNDGLALCKAYYDAYCSMINAGGCDILAHLDLVKKHNSRLQFFSSEDTEYKKMLVKTADQIASIRSSQTEEKLPVERLPIVEVNTGGIIRGGAAEPYPSLYILRLLKERNVPLVITADAHAPEHLGGAWETAWETMQEAGYSAEAVVLGQAG